MSNLDLIVITGAGRGIGKAAALKLGRSSSLILCISQSATCQETAAAISAAGGRAESLMLDLANLDATESAVATWLANRSFKRVGVVLAAAILGPSGPLITSDLNEWDIAYRAGVLGNLAVLKALLPAMMECRFGRILAFAGGGSANANPTFPAYSALKTATVRAVENLHEDLKDQGDFATVCMAPGAVETDMLTKFRKAGGYVRTTAAMDEPVNFIEAFLNCTSCGFSGRFVHVRDDYRRYLNSAEQLPAEPVWKLRRIEP